MADLDDEVDALYGLPLDAFVPERDALAKRLRADKRREEADAVKALRKPSVAAWAANQVLRSQPGQRDALLEAGDALRAAQEDLLAGRGDAAAAPAPAKRTKPKGKARTKKAKAADDDAAERERERQAAERERRKAAQAELKE